MSRPDHPFLQAVQISKRFGGVHALRATDQDVFPGEVIGVVGDTDSGKSTLLGLISGILKPDGGQFYIEGRPVHLFPSYRATHCGITVVHQDINAAEHMSVLSYIFAGQAPLSRPPLRWIGWWDKHELAERAAAEFHRLGFEPPPFDCPLNDLTSAQRQMVVFVHATILSPHLLLLDEPINALETYKPNIFRLIHDTRDRGGSVLIVTQNLDDVFQVSDRIVVLNAGQKIAERRTAETTEEEIVRLILGSVEEKLTPAVWALSNYFEVRRQAEELDRLNKALDRANHLKTVFLSNMSHELRTPLSAIIGLAQAMLDTSLKFYKTPLPEEYQHDLQTICRSGEHLLILINDILDMSKIEAGQIKLSQMAFDLKSMLDEALFTTRALLHGKPIELLHECPDVLPPVWADSVCTRQVVFNLLSNAAKFTEQGCITVRASVEGSEVVVCVSDTGVGIPAHVRPNIFDRFQRGDLATSRKYGGTGLGLSISKQLVELQGGRIWVESKVGKGSSFYFTIPVATALQCAQGGGSPAEAPFFAAKRSVIFDSQQEESAQASTRFVLLAHNDAVEAFSLQQALERDGCAVETTAVEWLAVEIAEVMLPDLIILDATDLEGPEILQSVISSPGLAQTPVIALVQGEPLSAHQPPADTLRQAPVVQLQKDKAAPQVVAQNARLICSSPCRE